MEISINVVLFEELKDRLDGGAEARIVILRESKDVNSALDSNAPDLDLPR